MTDEQQPRSGSRWEPSPADDSATTQPPVPPVNPDPYAAAPPRTPSRWARNRGVLAGAAAGLVAAAALGGFAVGHVNPTTNDGGQPGQVDTRFTPDRHGDPGQPPSWEDDGDGVPPPGQQPGQGSAEGTDTAYHS